MGWRGGRIQFAAGGIRLGIRAPEVSHGILTLNDVA